MPENPRKHHVSSRAKTVANRRIGLSAKEIKFLFIYSNIAHHGVPLSVIDGASRNPSEGKGRVMAVIGKAGSGKTLLLAELTKALRAAGVDLSRFVLVPDPGQRWLAVTAAIADVLPVVAVRPPARAKDADIARLAARMRERETVLLVQGPWPQTEAMIDVGDPSWSGLGEGYGLLDGRELTVTVTSRRFPSPRTGRVLLPDAEGAVSGITGAPVSEKRSAEPRWGLARAAG